MDKRYQIFVSSTYSDLEVERSKVIQTLMKMDCIPSGMELFPAADEEQFEFIKRVIDDCDYYLLIIGGRYGSMSLKGISYTEMEYEYAIEKGIKVIALLHKKPEKIPAGKSESDPEAQEKLKMFRARVSENRLVDYWEKSEELPGVVALSMLNAMKMYPAVGWVRANSLPSEKAQEKIILLEEQNIKLKEKLNRADPDAVIDINSLAKDNEIFEIEYAYELIFEGSSTKTTISDVYSASWNEIFSIISMSFVSPQVSQHAKNVLSKHIFKNIRESIKKEHGDNAEASGTTIDDDSFNTILLQFRALSLINHEGNKWSLSNKGDLKLLELKSIKSTIQNKNMANKTLADR